LKRSIQTWHCSKDFHNFELFNFLEAGDVPAESSYEIADINSANHDPGKLYIALEAALQL